MFYRARVVLASRRGRGAMKLSEQQTATRAYTYIVSLFGIVLASRRGRGAIIKRQTAREAQQGRL